MYRWLARHESDGDNGLESKRRRCGRKQLLTQAQQHILVDTVEDMPFTAATELRVQLQLPCSARTVRNYLHKAGVHSRRPAKKVALNEEHALARLEFARTHLEEEWDLVIFSDEKVFQTSQDTPRPLWRRNNTRFELKNVKQHRQSGRVSIGYWGWICSAGPGELVRIPSKMTAADYVDILENVMVPSVNALLPGIPITFVQDNSSVHNARIVQSWFERHPEIRKIQWPAKSPDLNPIENMWASMVRHWDDYPDLPVPRTHNLLDAHVHRIWEWHRGTNFCRNTVRSMRRRLEATIDANGYYTKY